MTTSALSSDFNNLLEYVAGNSQNHDHRSTWYEATSHLISEGFLPDAIASMKSLRPFNLGEVKALTFPWTSFGAVNSSHLFGLDEIILFAFYWANQSRYKNFLDLGANVGLHSMVALELGMDVVSVEPDPEHLQLLENNLRQTSSDRFQIMRGAATVSRQRVMFTRVEGNTTGSHVKGAKQDPYGDLTDFEVEGYPIAYLVEGRDLIKMDVEGLEADLLEPLFDSGFRGFEVVAEIGSPESASRIWRTSRLSGVNIFCQKTGWSIAEKESDLPQHHTEGSVFLSKDDSMQWL